nr:hypothetical protein [Nocardioides convexus]
MTDTSWAGSVLEAYERLIYDAARGDQTLFTSAEGIERLWEVSAPLLESPPVVRPYRQGSLGSQPGAPADRALRLAAALRAAVAQPERARRLGRLRTRRRGDPGPCGPETPSAYLIRRGSGPWSSTRTRRSTGRSRG